MPFSHCAYLVGNSLILVCATLVGLNPELASMLHPVRVSAAVAVVAAYNVGVYVWTNSR